jgi:NADH-quinone oxidoreductase subunit F
MEQPVAKIRTVRELETLRQSLIREKTPDRVLITICSGSGCHAYGCEQVTAAFKGELKKHGLEARVEVKTTGCHGFCERGPLVVLKPKNILYQRVRVEDVPEIVASSTAKDGIIERLLYEEPKTGRKITGVDDIPFYRTQQRLILGSNALLDPASIEDYIALGGYSALVRALVMGPESVIEEIKHSGLRGRGGGGFPTGAKWESTRHAPGAPKYVICNADEGDPGAYMDRSVMEGNPHSVLEGMIIAAYAIGAREAFVYIRNEYPLAVRNTELALRQAGDYGLLGENILGSGFDLSLRINRGGGAFVCGESTALMASLEGKAGEPRAKYVHTSEKGMWDQPTVLNNVETLANVPLIINRGAEWYRTIGTAGSKGTKIFSLVGKINNTGLVEVPMGITLRTIVEEIGGGIPGGKKFKAVQTGGPSGGCLPESMLDLPVDFDELTRAGSMMGSGAMIVMDEDTCMVDIARYFVHFLEGESCGKCVPCREGLKRMGEILDDIVSGRGSDRGIELLERLAVTLSDGALCALGTTAANPVMSALRYFRNEFDAHIKNKQCPAHVCKGLISFRVDKEKCSGCGLCVKACPSKAITLTAKKQPVVLNRTKCTKCGGCFDACRLEAILVE